MGVLRVFSGGQWIDLTVGAPGPPGPPGPGFTFMQSTTPTGAVAGNTWYRTDTGRSYLWYSSAWVEF